MDDETDQKGLIDYAWGHAVISDELYHQLKKSCNFSSDDVSIDCDSALSAYYSVYSIIDMYSLYTPKCFNDTDFKMPDQMRGIKGSKPKAYSKFVGEIRLQSEAPAFSRKFF